MATAEVASASLGPQYAPEDPTLAKPWKGLIDGSSGVLYYWNPESNVTQYEKPANLELPPPVLAAPSFTPKLAAIPGARSIQQMSQQQEVQQSSQVAQQWGQYSQPQQSIQVGEVSRNYTTQGVQPREQTIPPQQLSNQSFQQPRQQSFSHETQQQFPPPQVQRFPSPQIPYQQPPQQNPHLQGQQFPPPEGYKTGQGQQFPPPEGYKTGFSHNSGSDFQPGKESRFSSSQTPQIAVPPLQNLAQSGSSLVQQHGADPIHRQQMGGNMGHNQTPAMMNNQQHVAPSMRPKVGHEEDSGGRNGNGFYFSANKEGLLTGPQQPKITAMPMPQIQQGMRIPQSVGPSHVGMANSVPGHTRTHPYNNTAAGQAFNNYAPAVPSPGAHGPSAMTNLSAAEAYCREHEITATGDNVPAPFMTFEATGLPPEILREVRYLLQKRSICRTLHCYLYPYTQMLCSSGAAKYGWRFSVDNF